VEHRKNVRTVLLICAALLLAVTTSASAASKIGGKQIKKNAIAAKHIKKNAVGASEIKKGAVASGEIKDGTVGSGDLKNGAVDTGELAKGSVTASKIAPGAITFPNSIWSTSFRNQAGDAESGLQAGPETPPRGDGSLRLAVIGNADIAAYGDSFDFLGIPIENLETATYSTYVAEDPPVVRPSLRIEIDPHLVDDSIPGGTFEFTTLVHQPEPGDTGWEIHTDAQDDALWYLTGTEGADIDCTQDAPCTLEGVVTGLDASTDLDDAQPAISTGVYFGLGSGVAQPTESAVDELVLNGFVFDFEPTGVYLTPAS
jgi:hypothetical protein